MTNPEFQKLQDGSSDSFGESDIFQGYGGKKKDSRDYKDIVLSQIEKCRFEGSKQMIGSTEQYVPTSQGWVKAQFPDQRKVFRECVEQFYDLMFRYFDEGAKKNLNEVQKEINGLIKKYFELYLQRETDEEYKDLAKTTKSIQTGMNSDVGKKVLDSYENHKHKLYRKIYRELLLLFDRKNELKGRRIAQA